MKLTLTRVLATAFALIMCLSCCFSLASCSEKNDDNLPMADSTVKDTQAAVTTYVKDNMKVLDEVVSFLSTQKGVSYYYFFYDEKVKACRVEQLMFDQNNARVESTNKTLQKLAKARFTGEVSHTSTNKVELYTFYTYLKRENRAVYFVYCPADNAMEYLSDDFLSGESEVTVAPIKDDWYYVEAK